jgi:hypothetical protein
MHSHSPGRTSRDVDAPIARVVDCGRFTGYPSMTAFISASAGFCGSITDDLFAIRNHNATNRADSPSTSHYRLSLISSGRGQNTVFHQVFSGYSWLVARCLRIGRITRIPLFCPILAFNQQGGDYTLGWIPYRRPTAHDSGSRPPRRFARYTAQWIGSGCP